MAAWLASDKEKIRRFFGYPLTSLPLIQSKMDLVTALSSDAVGTAQYHLGELVKISAAIDSDRPYAAAASHSNSGSSTDYYPGQRLGIPREEGARHVRELSALLDALPVLRDVFAVETPRRSNKLSRS